MDGLPWFHIAPPPEWQWIFNIIGFIAFVLAVMSIPTLFQMFGGGPAIKVRFLTVTDDDTGALVLLFEVENETIGNWLRRLRVRREAALDVRALVGITDDQTHVSFPPSKVLVAQRIASTETARSPIAVVSEDGAHYFDDRRENVVLSPGYYTVSVHVMVGQDDFVGVGRMRIGYGRSDTWINAIS